MTLTAVYESVENGWVQGRLEELPGVITAAPTREEAEELLADALSEYLGSLEVAPRSGADQVPIQGDIRIEARDQPGVVPTQVATTKQAAVIRAKAAKQGRAIKADAKKEARKIARSAKAGRVTDRGTSRKSTRGR